MFRLVGARINDTRGAFKEYLELMWLNLVVKKRNFVEYLRVISRYYVNSLFMKADSALLLKYLFKSPYTISREFLQKQGADDVHAYGETPLTTLDFIAEECAISKNDTVFELGCGRGRGCLWLNIILGCKVVGIDYIPDYIEKAAQVKSKYGLDRVEFRLGDILESDFKDATVLYLYGTCYNAPFIQKLIKKLDLLPPGTKIITVSYPLTDYTTNGEFEVMKRFTAAFTWGEADVYLHLKQAKQ